MTRPGSSGRSSNMLCGGSEELDESLGLLGGPRERLAAAASTSQPHAGGAAQPQQLQPPQQAPQPTLPPSVQLPPTPAAPRGGPGDSFAFDSFEVSASQTWPAIAVGHPVAAGGLTFLADAPDAAALWAAQRPVMLLWLWTSLALLFVFGPLLASSAAFVGAQLAAVLAIAASAVQLRLSSGLASSMEVGSQLKLASALSACGLAAAGLDTVTAMLDVCLLARLSCAPSAEQQEAEAEAAACGAIARYAFVLGLVLLGHAWLSLVVVRRASGLLRLLSLRDVAVAL